MAGGRIHPAVAIIPLVVAGLVVVAILIFLRPAEPEALPVEAHSGEVNVESSVFIPSAVWSVENQRLEVAAIVTAHVEDSGVCRLEATHGDLVLDTQVDAMPDASTMTCGTMVLGDGIVPGEWRIVVAFIGDELQAESAPIVVEVER